MASADMTLLLTDARLLEGLVEVLGEELKIVDRSPSAYSSTFPIDRVAVRTSSGLIDLVCKYGGRRADPYTGHRRGTWYEASVYERVLANAAVRTPVYRGKFRLDADLCCLVFDFVEGYRVNRTPDSDSLIAACRALANTHLGTHVGATADLNRFDREYFTNWARHIALLNPSGPLAREALRQLFDALPYVVDTLARAEVSLIHGELYPDNVLFSSSEPVFLDWETAGLGPGMLDLSMLVEGRWDPMLVDRGISAYLQVYPANKRTKLVRGLAAARVYASAQTLRFMTESAVISSSLDAVEIAATALTLRIATVGQ